MLGAEAARVRAVLGALADLAPSGEQAREQARSVPLDWFRWLPAGAACVFTTAPLEYTQVEIDRVFGERLAAVDQIRPLQQSLRVGWMFVAGRTRSETGKTERLLHPLLTIPVRVDRPAGGFGAARLVPAGDPELTPLVRDQEARARLEADITVATGSAALPDTVEVGSMLPLMHRMRAWALDAAREAGLPATKLVSAGDAPEDLLRRDGLVLVAGAAVYAIHDTGGTSRSASLRQWASRPLREPTAFHTIYAGSPPPPVEEAVDEESPFLLTAAQRAAVAASRTEPLTVVSGAPGTGKSQTVVAIACDAVARGETVLVAARSDATVDALLDLLERAPGPRPVVFGSSERRLALARRLADGVPQVSRSAVDVARRELDAAVAARDALRRALTGRLTAHRLATGDSEVAALRDAAPLLFDVGAPLDAVDEKVAFARRRGGGWRARRALRTARRLAGAGDGVTPDTLLASVDLARAVAVARAADPGTPLPPTGDYRSLVAAEDRVRDRAARWIDLCSRSEARYDSRDARASVAALATALRSGRGARRAQLARLDRPLTRALPLWVGSLPDIDDLLPQAPGLFDLVVLDEASSIDQPLAAPALLRARRAVVVGDPKQLRHVSFLADAQLASVLAAHGLGEDPLLAATLDVRRNSAFDVAAGAAPVVTLDVHFRSRPHLVDFVARRIYGGAFAVAKRTPRTESVDCIHAECVSGRRGRSGVVQAEVDRVVAHLRTLRAGGATSIGVLSPFRAQADALEIAVLAAFDADDLIAMNVRVGTVHAFQGNERDHVVVSLGIGPDNKASWRFVEDRHLFAVLATRARQDLTLLRSADPPPGGLVADYLEQADTAPGRPAPGAVSEWAALLARELAAAGLDVVTGYPAGHERVDVCVYGFAPVAVVADLHAGGPSAHVDRCASLLRAGWEVIEALPRPHAPVTPSEVVVALVARLTQ